MSHWKKSPFHSQTTLRDRYPIEQDLLDTWAGDECFFPIEDSTFPLALHQANALDTYIEKAEEKGFSRTLRHDDSWLQKASSCCPLSYLANITEDWVPDIGMYAQERVLGPFAPYPNFLVLSGAILCFSPLLKHSITPAGRFSDTQKSLFNVDIGIQAKSPCMIWRQDNEKNCSPILPIAKQYIPNENEAVSNTPKAELFIGRIVPTQQGWQATCVLPIPVVGKQYVYNRLTMEWLKLQQSGARMFWEDVLRYRAELIYRSALEYCFIHAHKETLQCWESFFSDVVEES